MKRQQLFPRIIIILVLLILATHPGLSQSRLELPTAQARSGYLPKESQVDPSNKRYGLPISRPQRSLDGSRLDSSQDRWTPNPFGRSFKSTQSPSRTLKTNSDSVSIAWVRQYGSQQVPSWDEGTAIATDASGHVYVTGSSTKLPYGVDYVTIKYDPSGKQLWLARYDNGDDDVASAVAVDAAGNVYVTGTSERMSGGTEFATVKYSRDGVQQWVARYSDPGNSDVRAAAIALDKFGNVFVAGSSWDNRQSYATTIKYSSGGVREWVARYSWPGDVYNWLVTIAVDTLGNIYAAGGTESDGSYADYLTLKYKPDGTNLWAARYNGPRDEAEVVSAIGLDASGNVYVTGTSFLSGTFATEQNWSDFSTVKYSTSGGQLWARQYNGPDNTYDFGYAIAVDSTGNAYVTGSSDARAFSGDFLTVKYNPAGVQLWVDRYNGPVSDYDEGRAIILDGSGNLYVTGSSRSIGKEWYSDDYLTIKYNAAGIRQWIARYDGTGNEYDQPVAIALDASGNVYVTGRSDGPKGDGDYATIKYSPAGGQEWVARYNGPGNSY